MQTVPRGITHAGSVWYLYGSRLIFISGEPYGYHAEPGWVIPSGTRLYPEDKYRRVPTGNTRAPWGMTYGTRAGTVWVCWLGRPDYFAPGSEIARERTGQGAKGPESELARSYCPIRSWERLGLGTKRLGTGLIMTEQSVNAITHWSYDNLFALQKLRADSISNSTSKYYTLFVKIAKYVPSTSNATQLR